MLQSFRRKRKNAKTIEMELHSSPGDVIDSPRVLRTVLGPVSSEMNDLPP